MAMYQVLYWHGIPTQVRARGEDGRVSKALPPRFMAAVDKAAMASKSVSGDDYMAGFQWGERQKREGTAEDVTTAVVAELDAACPTIDHRAIALQLREERAKEQS